VISKAFRAPFAVATVVVVDTVAILVSNAIDAADLYFDPADEIAQGIVSKDKPYVTLLYGLLSAQAVRRCASMWMRCWGLVTRQLANYRSHGVQGESGLHVARSRSIDSRTRRSACAFTALAAHRYVPTRR
jgi:hypothetical protein